MTQKQLVCADHATYMFCLQRCYQDQGVRDQDQTKTRQAETETKTREAETKTKTSKKWS